MTIHHTKGPPATEDNKRHDVVMLHPERYCPGFNTRALHKENLLEILAKPRQYVVCHSSLYCIIIAHHFQEHNTR
jgi:hypothetical protein